MHRFFAGLSKPAPAGPRSNTGSSCCAVAERDGFHVFEGRTIVVDLATQLRVEGREERFEGRDWLEEQLRHRRPLGFDMEWRPDRQKDSDNPVALLQFADADTALLLRTHQTARWLPQLVVDALTSPLLKKVCVGYDGSDRKKLESSFGLGLSGVVDLADLGPRKGLQHTGLKRLAQDLGWKMRKESRVARSDWQSPSLTEEQVQYAAEDAYFTFKIFQELEGRPDEVPAETVEEAQEEMQSVLSLKPGWAEQGVIRRHDGLWCDVCKKGPMLNSEVMARHLESRTHAKKVQGPPDPGSGPAVEVPEALAARGIECGSPAHPRALPSEFICVVCDAGPFQTLDGAKAHLRGRQHLKNEQKTRGAEPEELPAELEAAGIEPCDEPGLYRCSLCDAGPFSDMQSAHRHVVGRQHQKRCAPAPTEAAEGAPADAAAAANSTAAALVRNGPQPEDLDILPGYVDLWEGDLMCSLCVAKANNLQTMLQHLCSEKHSKVCRKSGKAELIWVQERGRLEELETGRPVDREDELFDEDFIPPSRPAAAAPGAPASPAVALAPPVGPAAPSALQRARSNSEGRRVHFEGEAPACGLEAPVQPQPKDLATAKAWCCWSGRAKKASCDPRRSLGLDGPNFHGKSLVARVDVPAPPPGWVWDASTCLAVARGETVEVLQADGEWVYGQCDGRGGWLPAWALGHSVGEVLGMAVDGAAVEGVEGDAEVRDLVHVGPWTDAGTGGSAAAMDLRGRTLHARTDVGVPAGWAWDPASCLRLVAGEAVEVLASEGEWLYARSGAREGWLQLSAVHAAPESGDADCPGRVEVPASSGEAAFGDAGRAGREDTGVRDGAALHEELGALRPGALRQRLEEAGVAIPPGVLEKSELVELLLSAKGAGEEADRSVDNDSEVSTAPSSASLAGQDELARKASTVHGVAGPVGSARGQRAAESSPTAARGGDDVVLLKGHVARAREPVAATPEGFNLGQFLLLGVGDEVMLQYIHSGWAWGRAALCSGWVRTSVLGDRSESAVLGSALASVRGVEGTLVRVESPVEAALDGVDAATFLLLARGDALLVEHVTDDGWVWSFAGGRAGWAPASALCAPAADGAPQRVAAPCFSLRALRRVAGPPEGMDGANFLLLERGDEVHVEYVGDDGWLWGASGDVHGWVPSWAFDHSGIDREQGCEAQQQQPFAGTPFSPFGCGPMAAVGVVVEAC